MYENIREPPLPTPLRLYQTQMRHHVINVTYSHKVINTDWMRLKWKFQANIILRYCVVKAVNQVQPTLFRRDNKSCIPLSQIDVRCNYKICFGIRLPPFSSFCINSTVTFCCRNVILISIQNFIHNKLPLVFIENFQPLI